MIRLKFVLNGVHAQDIYLFHIMKWKNIMRLQKYVEYNLPKFFGLVKGNSGESAAQEWKVCLNCKDKTTYHVIFVSLF